MITASEVLKALEPQHLSDEALDAMLDKAANAALLLHQREFRLTVPRHSIDRASELARAAGWSTEVQTVRTGGPDAPDGLVCRAQGRSDRCTR